MMFPQYILIQKAGAAIRAFPGKITSVEDLPKTWGLGKKMLDKIKEILETGRLQKLDNFRREPKIVSLIELNKIWGVGPKTANELFSKGYVSITDIRKRGLHELTVSQRIGLKFVEEFQVRIFYDCLMSSYFARKLKIKFYLNIFTGEIGAYSADRSR